MRLRNTLHIAEEHRIPTTILSSCDPISIARALEHQRAQGQSRETAAHAIRLSVGHAQRYLRLLKLAPELQDLVRRRELSVTRAAALVGMQGLSVAAVRSVCNRPSGPSAAPIAIVGSWVSNTVPGVRR